FTGTSPVLTINQQLAFYLRWIKQGRYYAVKVLQKQMIVKRKEHSHPSRFFWLGTHFAYFAGITRLNQKFCPCLFLCRDVKPENILLDSDGHVVLTDFGLCKEGVAKGGIMHTFCGTPEYLAPEVLRGHPYSPAVDWWGLGTVLFEMICGLPPFHSHSKLEMFQNILHAPLQLPSSVSEAAHSLLEGLLEKDVSKRLGESRDIVELQEHPFFAFINWDDLLARKIRPPFIPKVAAPCDVSYIDPAFTRQPVPASVNERWQAAESCEAFLGFSYMNPAERVAAEPVS
uniref:Serum/glucocorticoid regulated kinase 2a n=1 Tax=Amphilophus citrinellus TaxID=61819 RepID=A0A3Q0RSY2_AMPCI